MIDWPSYEIYKEHIKVQTSVPIRHPLNLFNKELSKIVNVSCYKQSNCNTVTPSPTRL